MSWLSLISPFLSNLSFLSIPLVGMDTLGCACRVVGVCFYPPCAATTGLAHSIAAFLSGSDKALTSKLQALVGTKPILILQGRMVTFTACFSKMLLSVCTQKCASQKACRSSRASAPLSMVLQLDSKLNFDVKLCAFCLRRLLPTMFPFLTRKQT